MSSGGAYNGALRLPDEEAPAVANGAGMPQHAPPNKPEFELGDKAINPAYGPPIKPPQSACMNSTQAGRCLLVRAAGRGWGQQGGRDAVKEGGVTILPNLAHAAPSAFCTPSLRIHRGRQAQAQLL